MFLYKLSSKWSIHWHIHSFIQEVYIEDNILSWNIPFEFYLMWLKHSWREAMAFLLISNFWEPNSLCHNSKLKENKTIISVIRIFIVWERERGE